MQSSSLNIPEEVSDGASPVVAWTERRARFVQAIRSVIIAQQDSLGMPRTPSNIFNPEGVRQEELFGLIRSSRAARLAPCFDCLGITTESIPKLG